MKKLILALSILCFSSHCMAEEVITGFEKQTDLPVLNEELRRLDTKIRQVSDSFTTYTPSVSNALSGSIIQDRIYSTSSTDSTASNIPLDNTIPQIGEGKAISGFSQSITPSNASNTILVDVSAIVGNGAGTQILTLFKNGAADAVQTVYGAAAGPGMRLRYAFVAATTSTISFQVNFAGYSGTGYLNTYSDGTNVFNGTLTSSMEIKEIKA